MEQRQINSLTSLRFCFAFMIFLFHAGMYTPIALSQSLYRNVIAEGFIGVSFFYVLSGFVLSYSYEQQLLSRSTTVRSFWTARFARIYPLHLVTFLVALPVSIFSFPVFLSHLFLVQSFVPTDVYYFGFNGTAWSISDEFFFYALFPFLILLSTRRPKVFGGLLVIAAIIIISSALSIKDIQNDRMYRLGFWFFYICPLSRLTDFMLGILTFKAYKLMSKGVSSREASILEYISLALLILFFFFHKRVPFHFRLSWYYWLPMFCFILAFSFDKGRISRILSGATMVLLGKMSFALYLVHQLIMNYYDKFSPWHSSIIRFFILTVTCIFVSYLLHKKIEEPMNKWIKRKAFRHGKGLVIVSEASETETPVA